MLRIPYVQSIKWAAVGHGEGRVHACVYHDAMAALMPRDMLVFR